MLKEDIESAIIETRLAHADKDIIHKNYSQIQHMGDRTHIH